MRGWVQWILAMPARVARAVIAFFRARAGMPPVAPTRSPDVTDDVIPTPIELAEGLDLDAPLGDTRPTLSGRPQSPARRASTAPGSPSQHPPGRRRPQ